MTDLCADISNLNIDHESSVQSLCSGIDDMDVYTTDTEELPPRRERFDNICHAVFALRLDELPALQIYVQQYPKKANKVLCYMSSFGYTNTAIRNHVGPFIDVMIINHLHMLTEHTVRYVMRYLAEYDHALFLKLVHMNMPYVNQEYYVTLFYSAMIWVDLPWFQMIYGILLSVEDTVTRPPIIDNDGEHSFVRALVHVIICESDKVKPFIDWMATTPIFNYINKHGLVQSIMDEIDRTSPQYIHREYVDYLMSKCN